MILTEPVKPVGTRPAREEVERNRTDESTDRTPASATETKGSITSPGYEEMRQ